MTNLGSQVTKKANTFATKKIQERKLEQRRKKRIFLLVVILAIISAALYLTTSEFFNITSVNVTGARDEYNTEVRDTVLTDMQGSSLYIFPNSNIFLVNLKKINTSITSDMSIISSVKFERLGIRSLGVSISEREPAYLVRVVEGQDNLYLSKDGFVYIDRLPNNNKYILLTETNYTYASSSALEYPVGFSSKLGLEIDNLKLSSINNMVEALTSRGVVVYKIILRPYGDADFNIAGDDSGPLRVNLNDDADKVARTFVAARENSTFSSKFGSDTQSLDYVDLRFGDKVFYKFKDFASDSQVVGIE